MDTDFLLIQRMRMGYEDALEFFVKKYYPQILKYFRIHIADAGYAEDMTQETFVRFFGALQRYQDYGRAVNFLYVIARNLCTDFHRKNREIPVERLPDGPDCRGENRDVLMDVQAALLKLPEEIREVAVLYFIQERKQKDIARILGISLSLVKYRTGRARELLSACLGKENI